MTRKGFPQNSSLVYIHTYIHGYVYIDIVLLIVYLRNAATCIYSVAHIISKMVSERPIAPRLNKDYVHTYVCISERNSVEWFVFGMYFKDCVIRSYYVYIYMRLCAQDFTNETNIVV